MARLPVPGKAVSVFQRFGAFESRALAGAPAHALGPFPASRRTQLGTPNNRASCPLFLQLCTGPSRGLPRSLAVVPLSPG